MRSAVLTSARVATAALGIATAGLYTWSAYTQFTEGISLLNVGLGLVVSGLIVSSSISFWPRERRGSRANHLWLFGVCAGFKVVAFALTWEPVFLLPAGAFVGALGVTWIERMPGPRTGAA